jgi:serine/threonine-protein kinase
MILGDKQAKVMDFGIAKIPSLSVTTTGTVLGTPYYMSPEQISGQRVDIRSDIFSVGAIFYEMLTGERPFEGETTVTLAYKIVQVEPIPLRILKVHIPQSIEIICKKALAKDPSLRYQTPMEMLEDIRDFTGKGTRVTKPVAMADKTIKSQATIVVPKAPEEKRVEETLVSKEKMEAKPVEVDKKKAEPTPSVPPIKKESPAQPKPAVPQAPSAPRKADGSALKPITFAIVLVIIVVVGISLVVRFAKKSTPYSLSDTGTPQVVGNQPPQALPPEQKASLSVDALILQAKNQVRSNPAKARNLLTQAISLDPNNFEANYQLARLLTFQKDFQNAITFYQKAQNLNNRIPEIPFNMGYIYMNQGNFDQAIRSYEVCRALYPSFQDEVLTNMALCYIKKNNAGQARTLLQEALKLNPKNTIAQNYLNSIGG